MVHVIKIDVSEISMRLDFFRICGSRPQSEARHFDKELTGEESSVRCLLIRGETALEKWERVC